MVINNCLQHLKELLELYFFDFILLNWLEPLYLIIDDAVYCFLYVLVYPSNISLSLTRRGSSVGREAVNNYMLWADPRLIPTSLS